MGAGPGMKGNKAQWSMLTTKFANVRQAHVTHTSADFRAIPSDATCCKMPWQASNKRLNAIQASTKACGANLFTHYDTLVLVTVYHLSKSPPLVKKRASRCGTLLFIGRHYIYGEKGRWERGRTTAQSFRCRLLPRRQQEKHNRMTPSRCSRSSGGERAQLLWGIFRIIAPKAR